MMLASKLALEPVNHNTILVKEEYINESCMLVRFRFKFGDPRLEWKDILAENWKRLEEIETWLTHLAGLGFYSSRLPGWHFNKMGRPWVCNFTFCRLYAVPHASKWKIILLLKQKHETWEHDCTLYRLAAGPHPISNRLTAISNSCGPHNNLIWTGKKKDQENRKRAKKKREGDDIITSISLKEKNVMRIATFWSNYNKH